MNPLEIFPWLTTAVAVGFSIYLTFKVASAKNLSDKNRINNEIDLGNAKVVHSFDIEDLNSKTVFCRCWKSKKFPLCDGAHNKHNELTGDNLGPVIVQKK